MPLKCFPSSQSIDASRASTHADRPSHSAAKRWLKLLVACSLITLLWLIVLPWIGSQPSISETIRDHQARGIDPSAMFYTELEAMERILDRIDRLNDAHPQLFWIPNQKTTDTIKMNKRIHSQ